MNACATLKRSKMERTGEVDGTAGAEIQQLEEAFESLGLGRQVIEDVYYGAGKQLDRAIDALLSMSGVEQSNGADSCNDRTQGKCIGWHSLPQDLKAMVLTQLSRQELAQFALTCRDAREAVRETRSRSTAVTSPATVTSQGLIGLCVAYPKCEPSS